jgi:hypothetical protein
LMKFLKSFDIPWSILEIYCSFWIELWFYSWKLSISIIVSSLLDFQTDQKNVPIDISFNFLHRIFFVHHLLYQMDDYWNWKLHDYLITFGFRLTLKDFNQLLCFRFKFFFFLAKINEFC